jgi:hypothetical protein
MLIDTAGPIAADLEKAIAQFPFEVRHDLSKLVHWRGGADMPVHRWFRYREGYSPDLVTQLNLGKRVLDPFSGSGSILIGTAKTEREGVGIDVNPLACFVARTKLTPLSKSSLKLVKSFLATYAHSLQGVEPWPMPELNIAGKLFEPGVLDTVLRLRQAIENVGINDNAARDFLFLAWLSILEPVGSYFKEGNGIKYRNKKRTPAGYTTRIEGEWQLTRFGIDQQGFVLNKFTEQLQLMVDDTPFWEQGAWSSQRIINGSATRMDADLFEKPFDSVIFSPPYANRFDYFESQKVELWFGNFINSYEDMGVIRGKSLRSHLGAARGQETSEVELLEKLIGHMDQSASSWRMGVPNMLRGYFHDMYLTLQQCRVLAPKGECHVVVGNSAFAGVIIPTDSLIAQLGIKAGFKKAKLTEVRHLTVAPQQRAMLSGLEAHMRETIVTFS